MTLDDIKNIILAHKQELLDKYNIKSIGVFGSYARGEQTEESDIDLLVDLTTEDMNFFLFLEAEEFLSNLFNIKVDLVPKKGLRKYISKYILNDVIYI